MDNGLNLILIISLVLVTGYIVILLSFLIQVLKIVKRILTKIEIRVDNFALTQEEIKLKILDFVEEVLHKIRNFRKTNKI